VKSPYCNATYSTVATAHCTLYAMLCQPPPPKKPKVIFLLRYEPGGSAYSMPCTPPRGTCAVLYLQVKTVLSCTLLRVLYSQISMPSATSGTARTSSLQVTAQQPGTLM